MPLCCGETRLLEIGPSEQLVVSRASLIIQQTTRSGEFAAAERFNECERCRIDANAVFHYLAACTQGERINQVARARACLIHLHLPRALQPWRKIIDARAAPRMHIQSCQMGEQLKSTQFPACAWQMTSNYFRAQTHFVTRTRTRWRWKSLVR